MKWAQGCRNLSRVAARHCSSRLVTAAVACRVACLNLSFPDPRYIPAQAGPMYILPLIIISGWVLRVGPHGGSDLWNERGPGNPRKKVPLPSQGKGLHFRAARARPSPTTVSRLRSGAPPVRQQPRRAPLRTQRPASPGSSTGIRVLGSAGTCQDAALRPARVRPALPTNAPAPATSAWEPRAGAAVTVTLAATRGHFISPIKKISLKS